MLINKELLKRGCIFPENIKLIYLKTLIDLGSMPIVMVRYYNTSQKCPAILNTAHNINFKYPIGYELCDYEDIKEFLYAVEKDLRKKFDINWIIKKYLFSLIYK